MTTYFVGGHYEVTGSQVTKYYFAGTTRVAMRKYTIPQSMSVEYFLGDHLGSTSVTTDANGAKVSEMRYKAWGEVRYSWTAGQSTTPAYELAKYTFTGQYSHMDDPSTGGTKGFGLMFYNARWYDPALGRFAQADTIVPGGEQGLDRYAYVNNSPLVYVDPSGHNPECGPDGIYCDNDPSNDYIYDPLLVFSSEGDQAFSNEEKNVLLKGAWDVANAIVYRMQEQCEQELAMGMASDCSSIVDPAKAFFEVFGGPISVKRVTSTCDTGCWAQHMNKNSDGLYEIWVYSNTTEQAILTHPRLIVHEIGHAFYWAAGGYIEGSSVGERNGFYGPYYQWQFGHDSSGDLGTEIFADMFIGWVYRMWEPGDEPNGLSRNGAAKSAYMDKYMPLMINKAIGR